MNASQDFDMMEATRLTCAGRLDEAMMVIRSALAGGRASVIGRDFADRPCGIPVGPRPSILDMVPRFAGTEDAFTSPKFRNAHGASRPDGTSRLQIPVAFRGLLDRLGQFDPVHGLEALIGPAENQVQCPPLPDGARFEERMFTNEAGSRAYKLYLPASYTRQALPLVVMMHGGTQSPDDFAAGTRMNELAEEQGFVVAYPAQAWSANPAKCWNWFNAADQQRGYGEPSLIAGITRQVMCDFSIDPARIYIAGLSAGGAAAAVMGSAYPDLYTAIGVHSGLACGAASDMPSAFAAMRQGGRPTTTGVRPEGPARAVPTIVFHGDRDTIVHPTNGNQIIAQSNSAELRTTISHGAARGGMSYTRTVHIDESGRPILEQWVVHGAGHAWSGGSIAGSYTEPRGPDASREMMRFFLQHVRTTVTKS
jgi:poly(hydroxyalkanoate) depolymerase family esterase